MTLPSTKLPSSALEHNLQKVAFPQEQLTSLCQQHPIHKLSFFGSILRLDFTDSSDIELLVEFLPNARIGYFELIRIENELTDLIGRKVDLRTPNELSRYFRQEVLNEAVTRYVKD